MNTMPIVRRKSEIFVGPHGPFLERMRKKHPVIEPSGLRILDISTRFFCIVNALIQSPYRHFTGDMGYLSFRDYDAKYIKTPW